MTKKKGSVCGQQEHKHQMAVVTHSMVASEYSSYELLADHWLNSWKGQQKKKKTEKPHILGSCRWNVLSSDDLLSIWSSFPCSYSRSMFCQMTYFHPLRIPTESTCIFSFSKFDKQPGGFWYQTTTNPNLCFKGTQWRLHEWTTEHAVNFM